jgi:uncharacterized protein
MEVSSFKPGEFCWAELSTSDNAGAKQFYTSLFGWGYHDNQMGEDMVYTMLNKGGKNVGALYKDTLSGAPPHWGLYVSVTNADETAGKVAGLGGKVVMEPFDVMTFGRMAVIQDPQGAYLSLWQPKDHPGFGVVDEPGALCWAELNTSDVAAAGAFYTGLFGWGSKGGDTGYTEFQVGERSIAGMMAITPEMGPVPPHWLAYYQVTDCDQTVAKARDLGATIHVPGMDIPGVGRFGVIQDPQGAVFAVVKLGS